MKILLINPPFKYYYRYLTLGEPLSLAYLAAYLREAGYSANILDAVATGIKKVGPEYLYGLSDQEMVEKIKEFKPDLVGITCPFSLRSDSVLAVAKLVKNIDSNIITVVGGIHPTIFPKETVQHEDIDYVIIGEGEKDFLSLIKQIDSGGIINKDTVSGCAYKDGTDVKIIDKGDFIKDLDTLPFPARDLLPMEFYINRQNVLYGLGEKRSATVLTSRGCPRKCSFCSMFMSHGRGWRSRSAQNVFSEIKLLVEKYQIEEIFFMDDNLTLDKKRIMDLCHMIIDSGLKFKWNTPNGVELRSLDFELAKTMKKSGCINVCVGIESGSERVRNQIIGKNISREKIEDSLLACKKAGLPVNGFFILGIPGETENDFNETIKMIKELPFGMISTNFYTPLPGTKLYDDCVSKGYIASNYFDGVSRFNTPILETPDFNIKILKKWEKRIYFEFFKSKFWHLFFTWVTLRNSFIKWGLVRRFFKDKLNI